MTRRVNLAVLLLFQLVISSPTALAEESADFTTAVDDLLTRRTGNSEKLDHWFNLYSQGKIAEADKAWAGILKDCQKREEIGDLLENVNERCWFDDRAKKVHPENAYFHLYQFTEKVLGKEHRFVADIATFLATYCESRHDYKQALKYRLLDLRLHQKALEPGNHQVLEAKMEIGHLLITMKEYKQAEVYLKAAIAESKKYSNPNVLSKATSDLVGLLHATGRSKEAHQYMVQ